MKFILYLLIFYLVYKLLKLFFAPKRKTANHGPKVRTEAPKPEPIRQEDIIEASFEEIKSDDKEKV